MKRYLRLLKLFSQYSLVHAMIYKTDFIFWSVIATGWTIFNLLFYQLLYMRVDTIAGWTKAELILIQGFYFLFEAFLWGVFSSNLGRLPRKINRGTLDFDLTKPINTQFLLSFRHISLDNFTNIILGFVTIALAFRIGDFNLSLAGALQAMILFLFALVLIYSLYFSTMCIAFWQDRFDNLHHLFPSVREFWHYPHTFYQGIVRFTLITVIPIGAAVSLPSHALLGKLPIFLSLQLAVVSILSLFASSKIFNYAIKKYSSASS